MNRILGGKIGKCSSRQKETQFLYIQLKPSYVDQAFHSAIFLIHMEEIKKAFTALLKTLILFCLSLFSKFMHWKVVLSLLRARLFYQSDGGRG